MTQLQVFSEDALVALKRDHERLRYEVNHLHVMLRSFMSASGADSGLKSFCRFILVNPLSTTEASETATITHQYGRGRNHDTSASITVNNLLTHTAGTYVFTGDANDAGLAVYDPVTKQWYIVQMECP